MHFENHEEVPHSIPKEYWNLLDKEDKDAFLALQTSFRPNYLPNASHQINYPNVFKSPDTLNITSNMFQTELNSVKDFIERRTDHIQERSIIAGISFEGLFLSVNIQRLRALLNRCKSSLNKGFQKLGYISAKTNVKNYVSSNLPLLKDDQNELRKWTVRSKTQKNIKTSLPNFQFSHIQPVNQVRTPNTLFHIPILQNFNPINQINHPDTNIIKKNHTSTNKVNKLRNNIHKLNFQNFHENESKSYQAYSNNNLNTQFSNQFSNHLNSPFTTHLNTLNNPEKMNIRENLNRILPIPILKIQRSTSPSQNMPNLSLGYTDSNRTPFDENYFMTNDGKAADFDETHSTFADDAFFGSTFSFDDEMNKLDLQFNHDEEDPSSLWQTGQLDGSTLEIK